MRNSQIIEHLPPAFARAETWGIEWPADVDDGTHLDSCASEQLRAIAVAVTEEFRARFEAGTQLNLAALSDFRKVAIDNTVADEHTFEGTGIAVVQWVRHLKDPTALKHFFLAAVGAMAEADIQAASWFALVDLRQKIIVFCRLDDW